MELATLQDALPTFLATLLGIPCDWRKQERSMRVVSHALLDIISSPVIGTDELVSSDVLDSAMPPNVVGTKETVYGLRELTLQVTVWSLAQTLQDSARFYLERLRTRIRWSSSVAALKAMGIGLLTIAPITLGDPAQGGRFVSVAFVDARFSYGVAESDTTAPFVESYDLTGTFDNGDPSTSTIPES